MDSTGVSHELGATLCSFLSRAGHALGDTFAGVLYGEGCDRALDVVDFMVVAEFGGRRTVYVLCAREYVNEADVERHAQRVENVRAVAALTTDAASRWQLQTQAARMRSLFAGGAELLGVMAAPRMREEVVRAADVAGMECFTSAGALDFVFR